MALYYNVLYLMVKDYRETKAEQAEIQDSRRLDALSKITTYMREHYTEDLKLSDMAALFGYSDAYLSRMFKKYAKINFKAYLQEIRMSYAYRELSNTEKTISQIALDNGFANSRAFSGEFQKKYGILPSDFRQKLADNKRSKKCYRIVKKNGEKNIVCLLYSKACQDMVCFFQLKELAEKLWKTAGSEILSVSLSAF